MADESPSTAGKRFSDHLRQIREEREISVDEIHHETQIAESLIESFEAGRLYEHPTYNRVYLRSFVKAYADALNISRETALESLDAALEGTYDNRLASRYLSDGAEAEVPRGDAHSGSPSDPAGEEPASSPSRDPVETPDAPTAGGPEGRGGIVGPPRAVGEDPPAEADPDVPAQRVEDPPPSSRAGRSEDPTADDEETSAPEAPRTDAASSPSDTPEEPAPSSSSAPEGAAPDSSPTSEETPSWMEGGSEKSSASAEASSLEEEAAADEPTAPAPDPAPAASTEREEASPLGAGESGIVGEATELGSGTDEPSPGGDLGPSPRTNRGAARSEAGWVSTLLGNTPPVYLAGAGVAVVLLVLVGLGYAYFSSDAPEEPTAATSPPDTTMAASVSSAASTAPPQPPRADVRLGSTVHLTVLATTNVSALRIQRDEDLRRPYWIEAGEADVFPFQERVTLENGLSDVRLFVEGYPYPVSPQDTAGVLELTRSGLQTFVDTLRGAPASLSVSPDTIPVGTPTQ